MSETTTSKPGKVKSPDRQDRLAERLRENLKKRKEQARAREAKDCEGEEAS
ncbi:hypothetical protein [Azospirillum sp.]|uniref:hypothetical protein n=1 Tax=Azospirillum sp. TaxID=34012 RepID=UPI003D72A1DA